MLFNLTKGVYIRAAELSISDSSVGGLALAMLSRICWSGSQPKNNFMFLGSESLNLELGRGPWAGDRFFITTMEDAPDKAPNGQEWVDVSEETDAFTYHLWRHANRGDDLCEPGEESAFGEDSEEEQGEEVEEENDSDEEGWRRDQ